MASKPLSVEYDFEKELTGLKNSKDFKATPYFSPVPDVDLSFCFEYFFQEIMNHPRGSDYSISIFKLKLVRRPGSNVPSSLVMDADMKLYNGVSIYRDCFKTYKAASVKIQQMNVISFEDDVNKYSKDCYHAKKIEESNSMLLQCHFKIWDDSKNSVPRIWNESHLLDNFKQFASDFSSIYEPSVLSDIEFKIEEKSIPAHKAVLAAHSPVFLKMLTSEFQESKSSIITVTDSKYDQFTIFLKYLYTGKIDDQSWPNVSELYKLADKYDVAVLRSRCERIIHTILSVSSVSDILMLAYEYEDDDLKKRAIHFAVDHIKDVMCQEKWKDVVTSCTRAAYDVLVNFVPK